MEVLLEIGLFGVIGLFLYSCCERYNADKAVEADAVGRPKVVGKALILEDGVWYNIKDRGFTTTSKSYVKVSEWHDAGEMYILDKIVVFSNTHLHEQSVINYWALSLRDEMKEASKETSERLEKLWILHNL